MSFSIVRAGKTSEVVAEGSGAGEYGGTLGELTDRYIADVLDLCPPTRVIVEASGHADARVLSVTVTVKSVYHPKEAEPK